MTTVHLVVQSQVGMHVKRHTSSSCRHSWILSSHRNSLYMNNLQVMHSERGFWSIHNSFFLAQYNIHIGEELLVTYVNLDLGLREHCQELRA